MHESLDKAKLKKTGTVFSREYSPDEFAVVHSNRHVSLGKSILHGACSRHTAEGQVGGTSCGRTHGSTEEEGCGRRTPSDSCPVTCSGTSTCSNKGQGRRTARVKEKDRRGGWLTNTAPFLMLIVGLITIESTFGALSFRGEGALTIEYPQP